MYSITLTELACTATRNKKQRNLYWMYAYWTAMKCNLRTVWTGLANEWRQWLFIVYQASTSGVTSRQPYTGQRQVRSRAIGHVALCSHAVRRSVSATFRVSATTCMNVRRTTARLPVPPSIACGSASSVRSRSYILSCERCQEFSFRDLLLPGPQPCHAIVRWPSAQVSDWVAGEAAIP